jgi:hypothetical protein
MTITVTAQIQLRKGTAAAWTSADPTLALGEIGYETDTGKQKVGDGVKAWTALDYYYDPNEAIVTDHGALTGLSDDDHSQYHNDTRGDLRYAPLAKGVTNGDTHDHSGGDGAQIAYSGLSGLPTLGTAAATAATDYATAAHVHGNLTNAGAIGSTANLPVITSTSGVLAAGAFGTGATDFCVGNDSRLSDARTPTSHAHGNITNAGAIGVTENLPVITTTGGALTVGAFGTGATNFCAGNDSRLSDARTPTAHSHEGTAILSTGETGGAKFLREDGDGTSSWQSVPASHDAVTIADSTSIDLTLTGQQISAAAIFGTTAGTVCQGNDGRLDVAATAHAADSKTTPVDADELPLVDSAATFGLKRLTWANLKTTLSGVFALLAGKSGGQTLIGGTAVGDKLVLQGTTGNGTVTATALEVKVGNNGALSALNLLNSGQLIIQGDATTDLPVMGAELLTSAGWTVNTGWTESPDDTFAHSSGTDTLSHSATITNAAKYQISWTVTGRTAGSFTIAFGGVSLSGQTATGTFGPTATATTAFTITPTTDFNGTISAISLKRLTAVSTPIFAGKDSAGVVEVEIRAGTATGNCFIGKDAGGYCTTGIYNVALGALSQPRLTSGFNNVSIGYTAQSVLTTASNDIAIGYRSQLSLTTGNANNALGGDAQRSLTTGANNNAFGFQSQLFLTTGAGNLSLGTFSQYGATTGSYNTSIGYASGRYHADGSTALTDPEYCVYIGSNARGKDNNDENSVVIGGNTPIGLGANTTVIGTSATTLTRLYGNVATGVDAPSAAFHAIKTTEQLRLGYDASNYASFTVDSAGNLTIAETGTTPSLYTATLRAGVKVTPVTTTASPAATDTRTVYTNEGDADGATITLPTAVAGLQFTVCVDVAQTLTVTASSGDTIRIASNVTAAAGSITSAVVGSSVTLVAINATEWIATSSVGSWSF